MFGGAASLSSKCYRFPYFVSLPASKCSVLDRFFALEQILSINSTRSKHKSKPLCVCNLEFLHKDRMLVFAGKQTLTRKSIFVEGRCALVFASPQAIAVVREFSPSWSLDRRKRLTDSGSQKATGQGLAPLTENFYNQTTPKQPPNVFVCTEPRRHPNPL